MAKGKRTNNTNQEKKEEKIIHFNFLFSISLNILKEKLKINMETNNARSIVSFSRFLIIGWISRLI